MRPDNAVKSNNRFILELTQDWECILNTEKTGIHYYDDKIKGLRLIGEGLEDGNENFIEDEKGTGRIISTRDIELYKDECKPYIVAQKLIYDKMGMNGLKKSGSLGIVFNEPIQLYTSIESLTKEGIKIKFNEPFKENEMTKDGITLVLTQYGEIVDSVFLQNLKEGQLEAEGKFIEPIEDELNGEYFINNIRHVVCK